MSKEGSRNLNDDLLECCIHVYCITLLYVVQANMDKNMVPVRCHLPSKCILSAECPLFPKCTLSAECPLFAEVSPWQFVCRAPLSAECHLSAELTLSAELFF
jgi:hypothetical protein